MPPSVRQQQDRQAQRRLAVLRHAEEVTGSTRGWTIPGWPGPGVSPNV